MQYEVHKIEDIHQLEKVVPLFDAYRQFYKQSSDPSAAQKFLTNVFNDNTSILLVAYDKQKNEAIGFTQLYPMFSSVAMKKHWVLNDLYVKTEYRNQGIARLLIDAVHKFAIESGGDRITLKTEKTNTIAKHLYDELGYTMDNTFDHYTFYLK
jgi:ribosomal protein S18 acetylase RimI-like enzyme